MEKEIKPNIENIESNDLPKKRKHVDCLGSISFGLGLGAIINGLIYLPYPTIFTILGYLIGIAGLITGILGLKNKSKYKKMNKTGLILSIITLAWPVVILSLILIVLLFLFIFNVVSF